MICIISHAFLYQFGAGYLGILQMICFWLVFNLVNAWNKDFGGGYDGTALIICLWFAIRAQGSSVLNQPVKF